MKALLNKFKSMPENLKATLVFAIASFATVPYSAPERSRVKMGVVR